ncbi:hypothetical protein [Clostridium tertium]|uniref:DUF5666 domain-containing protein n=1 Tax=Clostridium tertium TaxID=1559 RepID=A0A6N3BP58_9CLOT
MKLKKSLIVIFSFLLCSFIIIGANPEKGINTKSPVFIGEIVDIQKGEDGKSTRITVDGFIKGVEVGKTKIVGIINEETKIMNSLNDKKENIELQKGDLVYMRLSEAMTKSIPPQVVVKRIFVTKNK